MAVGGAAYLVSKAIKTAKVVGFADLGMEAIYEFDVVDMPVTVAVDAGGTSAHITGPAEWQKRIATGEFNELRRLLGPAIELIATGEPVARHTRRLLEAANMLASDNNKPDFTSVITLLTTGTLTPLENAARRWLQLPTHCCATVNLPAG
jgi:hypothetical protein